MAVVGVPEYLRRVHGQVGVAGVEGHRRPEEAVVGEVAEERLQTAGEEEVVEVEHRQLQGEEGQDEQMAEEEEAVEERPKLEFLEAKVAEEVQPGKQQGVWQEEVAVRGLEQVLVEEQNRKECVSQQRGEAHRI